MTPTTASEPTVVQSNLLREGLRAVSFAAARTEDRPILTAICIEPGDGHLTLVAADNYRIAVYELETIGPVTLTEPILLRWRDAAKLDHLLPKDRAGTFDVSITTLVNPGRVHFAWTGHTVEWPKFDGTFPNYRPPFEKEAKRPAVTLTPALLTDLARALDKISASPVNVHISGPLDPVIIRPIGMDNLRIALMPVRRP